MEGGEQKIAKRKVGGTGNGGRRRDPTKKKKKEGMGITESKEREDQEGKQETGNTPISVA
jgi:hypothetical protein